MLLELIVNAGFEILENLLQLIISSAVSVGLYYTLRQRLKIIESRPADIFLIILAALLGMLLPLNIFGLLPVFFVFLRLGLKPYHVLPALCSNIIFNMLVPLKDPTFVFRTGYIRVITAFVTALAAGVALMYFKRVREILLIKKVPEMPDEAFGLFTVLKHIHHSINFMGGYVICGVLVNCIFSEYILYPLTSGLAGNRHTAFIPRYMARFDVVNPVFLMTLCIAYSLLNFVNLSALSMILKPKGIALFIGYYIAWAVLLGMSIFIL